MNRAAPISLAELSVLASAQTAAERDVAEAKASLIEANRKLQRLAEESVPMAMMELGLDKVKLSSGEEITVKQDVYCSITEENRDDAHAWLEEHDFGGMIKTNVIVSFGKDEMPFALALLKKLKGMKVAVEVMVPMPPKQVTKIVRGKRKIVVEKQKPKAKRVARALEPYSERSVHQQTLKAFLRDELSKATGEDIPLELFSARPVFVAKIKKPAAASSTTAVV